MNEYYLNQTNLFYFHLQMQPSTDISPHPVMQTQKIEEPSTLHLTQNTDNHPPSNPPQNQQNCDQPQSRNLLTPANPIIDKRKAPDSSINMKLVDNHKVNPNKRDKYLNSSLTKSKRLNQSFERPLENMTLFNGYDTNNLLYRKFDNKEFYQLNRKRHFASIFYPIYLRENNKFEMTVNMPSFEGMKKHSQIGHGSQSLIQNLQDELQFNSNFESGNLFAVFKTGAYEYDLVLQNDLNTAGCTQWFYFSVKNKKNTNIIAKFNIVNLYKTASLYNQGMKPMVCSSVSGKGWKRKGQNIFYEKNCIMREGSNKKKFYSSLSFSYDFTKENDTVEFAHAVPYTYTRLTQLIKTLQNSKKVQIQLKKCVVKSIGMTPLKKSIPIIKFESEDPRVQKKGIIFMARQHPGQTQGSFAIQEILLSFLKPSTQIDFLLWRFNIYIIPMINVDGVYLGNYRCNAMGYDLNRNWEGEEKSKHPEIVYIKNEIKKILAKQPIQLILDLHGHSNKINSFFYGNPFGPNPYVFPYAASKINSFIAFEECTFTLEKKQKAKTARSALGNLIKQTGNVYTYEMSFYGGTKNGKTVNFYQQNFRELGRDVLTAIYKIYVEAYKEEKTLKESLYLKEIRKEISKLEAEFACKMFTGSDSEADEQRDEMQEQRREQMQEKLREFLELKSTIEPLEQLVSLRQSHQPAQKDFDDCLVKIQSFSDRKHKVSYEGSPITQRMKRNNSLKPSHLESFIISNDESLQQKVKKHKQYAQRLKVFGQNLLPKCYGTNQSQQIQLQEGRSLKSMMKVSSIFDDRSRQAMRINFVIKTRNNRNKHNDYSTLSPTKNQWKEDQSLINDIVRVNRLEYKKIQREKDKVRAQKSIQRKNSNHGVFKLPSIVNNFKV